MTNSSKNLRLLTLVALLILMVAPAASYAGTLLGNHSLFPSVHPVGAVAAPNTLGFDCAYGASLETGAFPTSITTSSPYTTSDFDGTLDTSCQATYLGDTDGVIHPLVSDNPTLIVTGGAGGGVTVDVVAVLNSTETLNGFDISLQFNPHQLNGVVIDQTGLGFGGSGLPPGAFVLTLAHTIDNNAGTVRLAQVVVSAPAFAGTVELFRVRFDIVGSGISPITFFNDVLTNPAAVPHVSQSLTGGMDTQAIYDTLNAAVVGFQDSWTFTPSPEVVSQPITFSATSAVCAGCTAPFTYSWDFGVLDSGAFVASSTGQSVTITPPPPAVWRVELQVTDSAAHTFIVTRLLPLALLESPVNSALSVGVAGPTGGFTGKWLGGVVTATAGDVAAWRFCPGSALSTTICSSPAPSVTQAPTAITGIATVASETYHFAGVYNDSLTVHDASGSEQQFTFAVNQVIAVFFTTVTGTPAAYTIKTPVSGAAGIGTNSSSITAGQAINFTAFTSYSTTPLYPTASRVTAFKYTWNFGDGSPLAFSTSSSAGITGDNATSIVHTFLSACSPCTVTATAQEAGSATVAPSRIQESATVPVTVGGGAFSFSLAAAPATLSITGGGAGGVETATATLVSGTTTPVTFSILTALPAGVTASAFTPATFSLVVTPAGFDFSLAATPATLTIVGGAAGGVETASATLVAGVTTAVTFSITTVLPTGVTASAFTPASCSPSCSATVTLTASATAPGSTTTITIQAVGGGVTKTATFSLVVTPAGFDFSLAATPASLTILSGGAGGIETATATLVAGVSTAVTFSITTVLPTGVSASAFSPASCSPTCSATVTLTASATAPGSTTTITIQAVGGGVTRTATFSLVVTPAGFDFSLAATPATLTIVGGGAGGVETATATLVAGVTTAVTFSITTALPTGVTASAFTPASCSPTCSATVTLTASATAPGSTTTITIQAVGGGVTRTATFSLVVTPAGFDFSLAATPATLTIVGGGAGGVETATATLVAGVTT